jgi:hypothetical protein
MSFCFPAIVDKLALSGYSLIDMLGLQYKPVNFEAEKSRQSGSCAALTLVVWQ